MKKARVTITMTDKDMEEREVTLKCISDPPFPMPADPGAESKLTPAQNLALFCIEVMQKYLAEEG